MSRNSAVGGDERVVTHAVFGDDFGVDAISSRSASFPKGSDVRFTGGFLPFNERYVAHLVYGVQTAAAVDF
ncbi:unnamed protein product [Strongylus vulgaris]|uniref:Uncharacterized protein n=1 Tax=Strongylus vulgaris TaxID=40348 RepID=A0A3P7LI00_STRVU|nr:unnamed protein product [Strongylus vulgaris]